MTYATTIPDDPADLADITEAAGRRKQAEIGRRLVEGKIDRAEAVEALEGIQSAAIKPPRFTDFKPIIEGGFKRETPAVCEAMPGRFLLYAGRLNEFHGESGIGKTNISLAIARRIMDAGGIVLFLDPEDNPQGIAQRFIALGGNPDHLLTRFKYVHNPEPSDYPGLIEWAKQTKPTAVFLDGMAEALVAEGYNEDKTEDVLPFLRQRIRPFADNGAAVVIADHVAKNKESRGRNPRGSSSKLGRYDGCAYIVELIKAYSPTTAGAVRLLIAKDRNGGVGHVGEHIAELHFTPDEDGKTLVHFTTPAESGKAFLPTGLMEKISRFVETSDLVPSKNMIEQKVSGKVGCWRVLRRLPKTRHLKTRVRCEAREADIPNPVFCHASRRVWRRRSQSERTLLGRGSTPARLRWSRLASRYGKVCERSKRRFLRRRRFHERSCSALVSIAANGLPCPLHRGG